jgi:hypothetical protein
MRYGRGNGAQRNDLASRNPEPPTGGGAYTDLLCEVFAPVYNLFFHCQQVKKTLDEFSLMVGINLARMYTFSSGLGIKNENPNS